MPTYQAPGVYYETVDASPPAVAAARMDVAGFVGLAGRGPLHTPVPVESFHQFVACFGGFLPHGYLAYTVRAFFENGGRRCWIVRVASGKVANAASAELYATGSSPSDGPIWRIAASSPGTWGNALRVVVRRLHRAQARTLPAFSTPESARVTSVAGFARNTLVELSQPAAGAVLRTWRVIARVDAPEQTLHWVHPDPELRGAFDLGVDGFDPDQPVQVDSIEYTLLTFERGRLVAIDDRLSLVPVDANYGPTRLKAAAPEAPATGLDAPRAMPRVVIEECRVDPIPRALDVGQEMSLNLAGGSDGLAELAVSDFVGENVSPLASEAEQAAARRGLRAFELVDQVSMIAVPDIHVQPIVLPQYALPPEADLPDPCCPCPRGPVRSMAEPPDPGTDERPPVFSDEDVYRVQAALIQHCETRRDCIALLDPPFSAARDPLAGAAAVQAWAARFDSPFAALYFPWLSTPDPLGGSPTRPIPPSGHVAGCIAHADRTFGTHRAPANFDLAWAQNVSVTVDDPTHGLLNTLGINVIRHGIGRALRILGARMLASDPDQRYLNVRRLLIQIVRSLTRSFQWAVFEPNDNRLRRNVAWVLSGYLRALWRSGALVGDTEDQAFFVHCDETNNPFAARDRGEFLAQIGVAPTLPLEFVVLRVGRIEEELRVSEIGAAGGVAA